MKAFLICAAVLAALGGRVVLAVGTGAETGGGIDPLILFMLFMRVGIPALVLLSRYRKKEQARKTSNVKAVLDPSWDEELLTQQATEIFYVVQGAWTNRDMTPAQPYMSQEMFRNYQIRARVMESHGEQNILADIQIDRIQLADARGDVSGEYAVFEIQSTMVDYTIDGRGICIAGSPCAHRTLTEYWKLIRENGRWVLDGIDQQPHMRYRFSWYKGIYDESRKL